MKTTIFIILSLLFLNPLLHSQDGKSRNWEVKMYWNASFQQNETISDTQPTAIQINQSWDFDFNNIIVAASFSKKKLFHEFELVSVRLKAKDDVTLIKLTSNNSSFPISGSRTYRQSLQLRYTVGYTFKPFKNESLGIGIGGAISPYYSFWKDIPYTSASFPNSNFTIGNTFSIIPHFNFDLHKKVYLSVSVPFDLLDLNIETQKIQNPILSADERNSRNLNTTFQPKVYYARLGFGVRI